MDDAQDDPIVFTVNGLPLEQVTTFRYLGRVLSDDDSDLTAYMQNIARARAKWAQLRRVLRADGIKKKTCSRLYLVIVSAILLYGSETWVITARMRQLLTTFHIKVARQIAKALIRPYTNADGEEVWIHPSVKETLEEAHLKPILDYIDMRKKKFMLAVGHSPLMQRCELTGTDLTWPFQTYWSKANQPI